MLIYALLPDKGVKDFKQWRILFICSSFAFYFISYKSTFISFLLHCDALQCLATVLQNVCQPCWVK
jgi:hypothetical protein